MAPFLFPLLRRSFDPGPSSQVFSDQWTHPSDVFSILLLVGGDVILRGLAQLSGSGIVPMAFSFGIMPSITLTYATPLDLHTLIFGLVPHRMGRLRRSRTCVRRR